jgi:hypothetical protein
MCLCELTYDKFIKMIEIELYTLWRVKQKKNETCEDAIHSHYRMYTYVYLEYKNE